MSKKVKRQGRPRQRRRRLRQQRPRDRRAHRRGDGEGRQATASSRSKSRSTLQTELDLVEGMQFDRGYLSPYFVTNPDRMEAVLDEPLILIHEKKIAAMRDLLPLLEQVRAAGPRSFSSSPRTWRATRSPRSSSTACAAPSRSAPSRPRPSATAARPSSKTSRRSRAGASSPKTSASSWRSVTLEDLGARQARHRRQGQHDRRRGRGRAARPSRGASQTIRRQIEETTSDYDREKLQERLAKLAGGVAVIRVGAATETEMKEKKMRVEDAVNATRAAAQEGIVPGGGVALVRAAQRARQARRGGRRADGRASAPRAMEEPLRRIAENAGVDGAIVIGKVEESKGTVGFNAATGKFEDLVAAGIIDPTKVVRTALAERRLHRGAAADDRRGRHRRARAEEGRRAADAGRGRRLRLLKPKAKGKTVERQKYGGQCRLATFALLRLFTVFGLSRIVAENLLSRFVLLVRSVLKRDGDRTGHNGGTAHCI